MKRLVFSMLIVCLMSLPVFSQDDGIALLTPQDEVNSAISFLKDVPEEDKSFIRFFSTYSVQPERRDNCLLSLSFVCHSLVGKSSEDNFAKFSPLAIKVDGEIQKPQSVTDTLVYVDIRDYNWTVESWNKVCEKDPYFIAPIVEMPQGLVVRADWFLSKVLDFSDPEAYATLLYSRSTVPSKASEWKSHWKINTDESRKIGNEFGTLITKSKSPNQFNKQMFSYRTELGYFYESYCVNNESGRRNYFDSFFLNKQIGNPPAIADSGEMITTNQLGLQVYAFRNVSGDLVPSSSCITCHAGGLIETDNDLLAYYESLNGFVVSDKLQANILERKFLEGRFAESVLDNQKIYERALAKSNGLTPKENLESLQELLEVYNKDVTMETAAFECGMTLESFKSAIDKSDQKFGGRLRLELERNGTFNRSSWASDSEDGIPNQFQQSMIIAYSMDVEIKQQKKLPVKQKKQKPKPKAKEEEKKKPISLPKKPEKVEAKPQVSQDIPFPANYEKLYKPSTFADVYSSPNSKTKVLSIGSTVIVRALAANGDYYKIETTNAEKLFSGYVKSSDLVPYKGQ